MVVKTDSGNQYKCNVCGKKFTFYNTCKIHENSCGVCSLKEFIDNAESVDLTNTIPDFESGLKSVQTTLFSTGEHSMEQQPQLNPDNVVDRPTNTTETGTIEDWSEGSRVEVFDMEDGETPKYGERDDRMVSISGSVDVDGETFNFREVYRRHETISDQQDLGKFLKRYGEPEEGMEVDVKFNDDGQASIVV